VLKAISLKPVRQPHKVKVLELLEEELKLNTIASRVKVLA
jgi:hypothetical protein